MNLHQINHGSRFQELSITKSTIVHFIPDFGRTTADSLRSSGLMLSNCRGVVTKSRQLKLGGKIFNARKIYLDTKTNLSTLTPTNEKLINVFQTIPNELPKNSYIIIDHTIISQATQYITELTNSMRGLFFLFQQLKKEFNFVKSKLPSFENVIIFSLSPNINGTMYELLKGILTAPPDDILTNFNIFDRFILTSIRNIDNTSTILPIMGVDNKGKLEVYNGNLLYISKVFNTNEKQISTFKPVETKSISPFSIKVWNA